MFSINFVNEKAGPEEAGEEEAGVEKAREEDEEHREESVDESAEEEATSEVKDDDNNLIRKIKRKRTQSERRTPRRNAWLSRHIYVYVFVLAGGTSVVCMRSAGTTFTMT
jgi:hypothetical protein